MSELTMASLFDGSGGFPLASLYADIKPIWASEVEPFPIAVTKNKLPWMEHFGDVSKVDGAEVPCVDIISFGSPCQDLSNAGKRAGLDGARSGLFRQAIRIIKEMREKDEQRTDRRTDEPIRCRFAIWENVLGAFSSNNGEDFRCVLEEFCKVKDPEVYVPKPKKWEHAGCIMGDSYSVAWRVFDAQYWGVPQRRQRIYLVADFNGGGATEILFESEGLSRYSAKSQRAWKDSACFVTKGTREAGNGVVFENHPLDSRIKGPIDVSQTLGVFDSNGDNLPIVMQAYGICSKDSNSMKSSNPHSGIYEADTSRTIDCSGANPNCNQGGICVIEGNGSRPSHLGDGYKESDVMYTLNATEVHGVAFSNVHAPLNAVDGEKGVRSQMMNAPEENFVADEINDKGLYWWHSHTDAMVGPLDVANTLDTRADIQGRVVEKVYTSSKQYHFTKGHEDIADTLTATDWKEPPIVTDSKSYGFYPQMKAECVTLTEEKSGCLLNGTNPGYQNGVVEGEYIVRRLTPTECARLQGFPDWWCDGLAIENPSDDIVKEWESIFETHRKIIGKPSKPKTRKQIVDFLRNPNSDAAEYKMWGNGVALPNVCFIMAGIKWYMEKEHGKEQEDK